jgi:thiol-disulfide isomerase/thioredoxin
MNKKSIITILAIIILPILAFFVMTFNKTTSTLAEATGKPQVIKFSSTMCLECKEVEKVFKEILPKYQDKIEYTSIIVDGRDDMNNSLIEKYNVTLVPTIIMLNSDGTQYKRIESALPKAEMEKYIQGLH